MAKARGLLLIAAVFITAAWLVGCAKTGMPTAKTKEGFSGAGESGGRQVSLIISAAASLKDAMEEIKQLYREQKPGVAVTYNFGASGSLQRQIEQGAPVDIYMPAAQRQMDMLKDKGLIIEDTNRNLLKNKVVLIVAKDSKLLKGFEDLADDKVGKVALGEPKSVPAGQYSEEILAFVNIKEKVWPKAVFAKDVREILTWVETGNVDAGIVYATDAEVTDKVRVAAFAPEEFHSPVIYPAAVVKDSQNVEAAKEFLEFLADDKSKTIFEKFGFTMMN